MKELIMQKVKIQDVVDGIVKIVENGDALTSTGRNIGCIESPNGRVYALQITATCDEDDILFGDRFPLLDGDFYRAGNGLVCAPEGHFPSAEPYEDE